MNLTSADERMGQKSDKDVAAAAARRRSGDDRFRVDDFLRPPFGESEQLGDNGLVLCGRFVPDELVALALSFVDAWTLDTACRLVCKRWHDLAREAWKAKAERERAELFGGAARRRRLLPWSVYRSTVLGRGCYGRNLLENGSAQQGLEHWDVENNGGDKWIAETPPVGVRPDGVEESHGSAFVTSYVLCVKKQIIDLVREGITPHILDTYQPDIHVSERYAARWDCGAVYLLEVQLLSDKKLVLRKFTFDKRMRDWRGWEEVKYTFESYGPGVRYVLFRHGGKDDQFWAGHYGAKMTGASVRIPLDGIREPKESLPLFEDNVENVEEGASIGGMLFGGLAVAGDYVDTSDSSDSDD